MKNPYHQAVAVSLLFTFTTSAVGAGEISHQAVGTGIGGEPGAGTAVITSKTSTLTRTVAASAAMTPLESSLALWRKGDKNGAVEKFLQIDWTGKKSPFQQGSPLLTREQDLPKMSTGDRERLMREVNAQLKDLKQLASAARDKALASADKTAARRWLAKLDECGAALDQDDAMLIVKLTGRAIRKLAATGS